MTKAILTELARPPMLLRMPVKLIYLTVTISASLLIWTSISYVYLVAFNALFVLISRIMFSPPRSYWKLR